MKKENNLPRPIKLNPIIPAWLIWIQCTAFVVLYAVWILPEIVGFRNTALVVGGLASLYSIYQYRDALLKRTALSVWCIVALFIWAVVHLLFFSQDYVQQLMELKRIWKYAAIASIFAFGLGLSLASINSSFDPNSLKKSSMYWSIIFFGLTTPVLIYIIKYSLTTYGANWGIEPPAYFKIYFWSEPFYVPKSDYIAFCLPPLAIALGQIYTIVLERHKLILGDYGKLIVNMALIVATLFLFYIQNIKNGMAHSTLCIGLFIVLIFLKVSNVGWWKKFLCLVVSVGFMFIWLYTHVQKNDSWKTLIADTKIAFQTEKYDHWKYASAHGYPNNEYGKMVSNTNYDRAAWFKIGNQLAFQNPLGYGLIEDSFKRMAKARWPEVSPSLSHSHSGWLDLILAIGYPGFALIMSALLVLLFQSRSVSHPWGSLIFWGLIAQTLLWITTEVSATVTFAALIFWLCWSAGLCIPQKFPKN